MIGSLIGPLLLALGLVSAAAGLYVLEIGDAWGVYLYVLATVLFLAGALLQIKYLRLLSARKEQLKSAERAEKVQQLREMIGQMKARDERREDKT